MLAPQADPDAPTRTHAARSRRAPVLAAALLLAGAVVALASAVRHGASLASKHALWEFKAARDELRLDAWLLDAVDRALRGESPLDHAGGDSGPLCLPEGVDLDAYYEAQRADAGRRGALLAAQIDELATRHRATCDRALALADTAQRAGGDAAAFARAERPMIFYLAARAEAILARAHPDDPAHGAAARALLAQARDVGFARTDDLARDRAFAGVATVRDGVATATD